MQRAIDIVHQVSVLLLQQSWRQWAGPTNSAADNLLSQSISSLLEFGRYDAVDTLAKYGSQVGFGSDEALRTITVNQCLALEAMGRAAEIPQALSALDWTTCALKFRIAAHILLKDWQPLPALIYEALKAGELTPINLTEWPLFEAVRGEQWFQALLQNA